MLRWSGTDRTEDATPIFEYRCESCDQVFDCLVRGAERPSCPKCGGVVLERRLTTFAVSSVERSSRALAAAREAYRRSPDRAERRLHEAKEMREHLQEDYGLDVRK